MVGCTGTDRPAGDGGGRRSRTASRVLAALTALGSLAVTAACADDLEPDAMVGEFVGTTTDGTVRLTDDGTFVATAVPLSALEDPGSTGDVDLSGRWELLEISGSDVVYLTVDEVTGADTGTRGVQLWVSGPDEVYLMPDADRPGTRTVYERRR